MNKIEEPLLVKISNEEERKKNIFLKEEILCLSYFCLI